MEPEKIKRSIRRTRIIVIILIIGGIYMWKVNQKAIEQRTIASYH